MDEVGQPPAQLGDGVRRDARLMPMYIPPLDHLQPEYYPITNVGELSLLLRNLWLEPYWSYAPYTPWRVGV